ncbi:histidine phosphatase family protein [candidate division CSSED10-310 bacterium]|uniref:Histidine phosphatase family protein n=1 Tax=candidate division CSSED10-310 bacterium TaxID=2855610 RepID=A0ABV6Z5A1_UNCC1
MKTILVMRHAQAGWSRYISSDFERPLNEKGLKDAPLIGKFIKEIKVIPDLILSSPAKRARQTADTVAQNCGFQGEISFVKEFYSGDELVVRASMADLSDTVNTVLIVGHNPTLEDLISAMTSDGSFRINLETAALSCMVPSIKKWAEIENKHSVLLWLVTPELARNLVVKDGVQ